MDTGVEAGLRYSEAEVVEARLRRVEVDLVSRLKNLDRVATIAFNRMADWGADGRVTHSAPVHSPFIRRRLDLQLE